MVRHKESEDTKFTTSSSSVGQKSMWDREKLDVEEKQLGTDGNTKPDPPGESHLY